MSTEFKLQLIKIVAGISAIALAVIPIIWNKKVLAIRNGLLICLALLSVMFIWHQSKIEGIEMQNSKTDMDSVKTQLNNVLKLNAEVKSAITYSGLLYDTAQKKIIITSKFYILHPNIAIQKGDHNYQKNDFNK